MEKIPAAPIPATALQIINMIILYKIVSLLSQSTLNLPLFITLAKAHNKEPNKNTQIPKTRIHLRPKISESFANKGSNMVVSIRYDVIFFIIFHLRQASNVRI